MVLQTLAPPSFNITNTTSSQCGSDEIKFLSTVYTGADKEAEEKKNSGVFISSLVVPLFHQITVYFLSEHYHNYLTDCHRVCVEFWSLNADSGCRSMFDVTRCAVLYLCCPATC